MFIENPAASTIRLKLRNMFSIKYAANNCKLNIYSIQDRSGLSDKNEYFMRLNCGLISFTTFVNTRDDL